MLDIMSNRMVNWMRCLLACFAVLRGNQNLLSTLSFFFFFFFVWFSLVP